MAKNIKTDRAAKPSGSGPNQEEYWKSLSRSFNKDFIKAAKEEHDKRKRLQVA
ncbi:hypothetical protein [Bifidobacterium scaligerum]|uniref:hypothetical protein n=1 Tax=Bifidobacterium scaligerum TaxID=2052656 RepID=UPI0013FD2D2C|nr:hypothetical protein [Bifidobacterium scaligerum]